MTAPVDVRPVTPRHPQVPAMLDALTGELAQAQYPAEEMFGYSAEQLERLGVHLVGAYRGDTLVGVAGVELQDAGFAELKRFFVAPAHRGTGVADALITALLRHADAARVQVVRLETGHRQLAAQAFYRRHGFTDVEPFGPYVGSSSSVCMQLPR